jgi:hypothetical protein
MAQEGLMKVYRATTWLSWMQEETTISEPEGRYHNLVCVLGTGVGKTGLIVIPAKMEARLDLQMPTIVIMPMVALAGDMVRTCMEKQVCCIQYDPAYPYLYASVVVVVADRESNGKDRSHLIARCSIYFTSHRINLASKFLYAQHNSEIIWR